MSLTERHGARYNVHSVGDGFKIVDSSVSPYSTWHRQGPADITFIDIDWIEYCDKCYEPLLLCEVAHGLDNVGKPFGVTQSLARRADIPAVVLLFETSDDDKRSGFVSQFRIREVYPSVSDYRLYLPREWAQRLMALHRNHVCVSRKAL